MTGENTKYYEAARLIKKAGKVVAFTGAGISVESGIPPFRGEKGLWNKYNPDHFHIQFFHNHPGEAWGLIQKLFKGNGATIIEINTKESHYTHRITDIFLKGRASVELIHLCNVPDISGVKT